MSKAMILTIKGYTPMRNRVIEACEGHKDIYSTYNSSNDYEQDIRYGDIDTEWVYKIPEEAIVLEEVI